MRNISERIVPNAIVYGISGADELHGKLGRERPLTRVQESLRNSVFPVRAVFAKDIIGAEGRYTPQSVFLQCSQMCDETAAKLRLISDI